MKRANIFLLKVNGSFSIDKFDLLKIILKKYYNINFNKEELYYNNYGKPMHKDFCFNFSDSKNYIALIISKGNVGIDIEYQRYIPNEMMDDILHDNEKPPKYNLLYYWVCKEAYVKYLGDGITNYLNKLDTKKITKGIYTYKYITNDLYLYAFSSLKILNKIIEVDINDMLKLLI